MNETTLRVEGEDVVYVNFPGTAKVRLVAFFKDKKSAERKVLYANLFTPGGKHTMARSLFEKEFAETITNAPAPASLMTADEVPF